MKLVGFLLMAILTLWLIGEVSPSVATVGNKSMFTHRNSTLPGAEIENEETQRINKVFQEAIVWGVILSLVLIISAFLFCPFCCYCIAEHCQGSSRGGYLNI